MINNKDWIYFCLILLSCACIANSCAPKKVKTPNPQQLMECKINTRCVPLNDCLVHKLKSIIEVRKLTDRRCGKTLSEMKVCCDEEMHDPLNTDFFPENCGRSLAANRIIGGINTTLGEFPWLVALLYSRVSSPENIGLHCAGSLINSRYVLTAAHCLHRESLSDLILREIRIGDHDLMSTEDCSDGGDDDDSETYCAPPYLTAQVEEQILHPRYDDTYKFHDIALIRLSITVRMGLERGSIVPICLPPADVDPQVLATMSGRVPMAVGWGYTTKEETNDIPLKVTLPFHDKDTCVEKLGIMTKLITQQICLGGEKAMDSCRGDSGGPLMLVGNREDPLTQIGIVSYGPTTCGIEDKPGVYTSVSHYIQWMKTVIKPWR